jgi:argininosuccinate lyase
MATMREAIERAVRGDVVAAGRVSDLLRDRGLNYRETYEFVNGVVPVSAAAWDSLLYEADTVEGI